MGLRDLFGRKKKEPELDPIADLVLGKLKVGYLLDYDLKTWEVTSYCRYEFSGDIVEEWEITAAGRERRYLELAEERWSLSEKIVIGAIEGDIRRQILREEDPPSRIVYKGKQYNLDNSYAGSMFPNGEGDGEEVIRWEFMEEDEENFLGIEQWSETELRAAAGFFVEDYEFTNILPGGARSDFLPGGVEALRYTGVVRISMSGGTGREVTMNRTLRWIASVGLSLLLAGCAARNPLERLQREFDPYPEYSVILADMREEGTFSTDYLHQYRVTTGQREEGSDDLVYAEKIRDWERVDRPTYAKYQPYLGMVILSKGPDGKVDHNQHPPGYQYVGNDRYGRWQNDGRGGSVWGFYAQYALIGLMVGGLRRPIYRNDWNTYRDYRGRGQPYVGGAYGTNGTVTRQSNPNFFRRQEARQRVRTQGFADRVRGRMSAGSARGLGK